MDIYCVHLKFDEIVHDFVGIRLELFFVRRCVLPFVIRKPYAPDFFGNGDGFISFIAREVFAVLLSLFGSRLIFSFIACRGTRNICIGCARGFVAIRNVSVFTGITGICIIIAGGCIAGYGIAGIVFGICRISCRVRDRTLVLCCIRHNCRIR